MSKTQIKKIGNYNSLKPIRIWLGNLAKYNQGKLKGAWLYLPMAESELNQAFEVIVGQDEEYIINDFECEIEGLVSKINQL